MYAESKQAKRKTHFFMALFTFVYFTSYVTRINFGAVIAEIIQSEGILKSTASLAVTGSAVFYGCGQLLSGWLGDKIQPKRMISIGFITTILMNLSIPLCKNPYQMTVCWSINGLAQAFMWPPLVKIMTNVFSVEDYKKAVMLVSWGSSFGTIAVYLTAPLLITLSGWRAVFVACASAAAVMEIIWLFKCPKITLDAKTVKKKEGGRTFPWSFMIVGIIVAIILQGFLRDGVSTWMPSLISETFNLSVNISIFSGIVFPMFSIAVFYIVTWIYRKRVHNELYLAGLIFCVGAVSALLLALFREKNPVLTVVLISLLIGTMHGVNLMLICLVPSHYEKFGRISLVSGMFNSFTYLGSAVSAYGMAAYTEQFGWRSMIFFWGAVALAGGLICLALTKKWRAFRRS